MRRSRFTPWKLVLPLAYACAVVSIGAQPARADEPTLTITPRSSLSFGSFAVFGSGSRTVTPQGAVLDSNIFADPNGVISPAQFDLVFDRGNESKFPVDVLIQLVLSAPPGHFQPGMNASVSALTSTLPGASSVLPGQAINLTISRCTQRVCGMSFTVGGRIDVTRGFGGGNIVIPLPVDATIIVIK